MKDPLRFRRQFLLSDRAVSELQDWQYQEVAGLHLYAHRDLEVTTRREGNHCLVLLGDMFDPFHPEKTNNEIVSDIMPRVNDLCDLFDALKRYAGRYALLCGNGKDFVIVHDPLGTREIYYSVLQNKVICGSQPNLIDEFSDPKLGITKNQDILEFYEKDMKLVRSGRLWVGDETYFHGVKHLMPNHYLDLRSLIAKRYWPNRRLERLNLDQGVGLSCEFLKGVLKAVTLRYDVMMAVTSGYDSRSLLAASRDVKDRIYYFVNKEPPLNDDSADVRIPRMIFERLKIPFHIHDVVGAVDERFEKVFLQNVFMSTGLILPTIYNVYFKKHSQRVNLLGVGEIGRDYFGKAPRNVSGYYLARSLKYKRSMYATAQCERWLMKTKGVAEEKNVDIMKLLLWEGLLGNWGVVGNSESDIAIEEFDPYSSHYIYEIMLSVDQSQGDLFEGMFKEMWPELLEFPINPPETLRDWLRNWLIRMGLFHFLKRWRYSIDEKLFSWRKV